MFCELCWLEFSIATMVPCHISLERIEWWRRENIWTNSSIRLTTLFSEFYWCHNMLYEAIGCAGDTAFSNVCVSMHTLNYSKTYSICFTHDTSYIQPPQPCIKTNNWQRNSCNHKPIVFNKITCLQRCSPSFTIWLWTSTISVSYSVYEFQCECGFMCE